MLHVLCFGHCAVCLSWRHIWLAQEVCNGATLTSSLEQAVSVLPLPVPPCTRTHTYKHTCIQHSHTWFPCFPFTTPQWGKRPVTLFYTPQMRYSIFKVWCSLLKALQDAVLQMWMILTILRLVGGREVLILCESNQTLMHI